MRELNAIFGFLRSMGPPSIKGVWVTPVTVPVNLFGGGWCVVVSGYVEGYRALWLCLILIENLIRIGRDVRGAVAQYTKMLCPCAQRTSGFAKFAGFIERLL